MGEGGCLHCEFQSLLSLEVQICQFSYFLLNFKGLLKFRCSRFKVPTNWMTLDLRVQILRCVLWCTIHEFYLKTPDKQVSLNHPEDDFWLMVQLHVKQRNEKELFFCFIPYNVYLFCLLMSSERFFFFFNASKCCCPTLFSFSINHVGLLAQKGNVTLICHIHI